MNTQYREVQKGGRSDLLEESELIKTSGDPCLLETGVERALPLVAAQ